MIELDTEVAIVGSGFGGAVAASRLVDKGVAVVVLERGPWRNTRPVNSMNVRKHAELPRRSFSHLLRKGVMAVCHHRLPWARGIGINRRNGTYEVHCHRGFVSAATSQVGGGSLVWAGLVDRPLDPGFWDGVAEGVSEALLAPHFTRVKTELGACRAAGFGIDFPKALLGRLQGDSRFDLSLNADAVTAHRLKEAAEDPGYGIERGVSQHHGHLSFGCLDGSKASTDAVYLGPALAKGLQLLAQCEVESVQRRREGGFCVYARHGATAQPVRVLCSKLVMGAGTYHTLQLLLEAQRDNYLQPMPGLGKGVGVNGDEMAVVLDMVNGDSEADRQGLFTSFTLTQGNPRLLHGFINADFPTPGSKLLRRLFGPLLRSAFLVCMGEDVANGVAVLKKRRLQISYQPRGYDTNRVAAEENHRVVKFLGKKAITFGKTMTAHLFGGARVSRDATEGVVNGLGQCHQNAGLYIVDAAAIPKSPGRPPSLNITAWASHVADNLADTCDSGKLTSMKTEFEHSLNHPRAAELALVFAALPTARATQASSLTGDWRLNTLTPEQRRLKRRFHRLWGEVQSLKLSVSESALENLKPQHAALNAALLANSWDGSGLVYQLATALKGVQVTLQLRQLPDREDWLVRSASETDFLGWHLLTR